MIRINFALRRLPELSLEAFQCYWAETHGPLVASMQAALAVRRYVQSHTLEHPMGDQVRAARAGMQDPFDGIASLWWDDRDTLASASTTPEGREAGELLLNDERNFIDLSRSAIWLSEEIPQINPIPENGIVATPRSSWVKICYLLNAIPGMSKQECQRTWRMEHGYLIRRYSGATRFHRYIQNHTLDDPMAEALRASRGCAEPYLGLTEAWFDRYDLERIFASPDSEGAQGFDAFLEDEKRFIDFSRSSVWLSKELVFIDRL